MVIYLNGQRVDYENAKVSVEDRGFQFGDGIYEVVRVYEGRFFYLNRHLERLKNGAREIYLDLDFGIDTLEKTCRQAVKESGFDNASVYIQVTRGTAPRKHIFPEKSSCNWVVIVREEKGIPDEAYKNGVMAITIPDERWSRCNIKTIQLLANCIAKQKAKKANVYEAIFYRGDIITEASSSNVFAVKYNVIFTHPANNFILNGVTRRVIFDIASENDLEICEERFRLKDLMEADEVFITGTTTQVLPIVKIDGKLIGDGVPGKITCSIIEEFNKLTKSVDC